MVRGVMSSTVAPRVIRAYLRISKRTDESQSIEQQRNKVERWRDYHHPGVPIVWYVDEGVSGSKAVRRPERERLLVELSGGDVLLSMKVDRLARSTRDLLDIVKHAEDRGARVAFTDQQIDTGGPYGRFTLILLAALAELEAGIISERVQNAYAEFDASGRHGYGRLPFGFRSVRDPETGWLAVRPDPDDGPRLRKALLRIIEGASALSQANDLGIPQVNLWKLLRNPRLYGRGPSGKVDPDAALLGFAEWQSLQGTLRGPRPTPAKMAPGYGPVLRCWRCGSRLYLNRAAKVSHGGQYQTKRCDHDGGVTVLRDQADAFIEQHILTLYGHQQVRKVIRESVDDDRVERLAELDTELDAVWVAMRTAAAGERAVLLAQVDELERSKASLSEEGSEVITVEVDAGTLSDLWGAASYTERCDLFAQIGTVAVYPAGHPARMEVRPGPGADHEPDDSDLWFEWAPGFNGS